MHLQFARQLLSVKEMSLLSERSEGREMQGELGELLHWYDMISSLVYSVAENIV